MTSKHTQTHSRHKPHTNTVDRPCTHHAHACPHTHQHQHTHACIYTPAPPTETHTDKHGETLDVTKKRAGGEGEREEVVKAWRGRGDGVKRVREGAWRRLLFVTSKNAHTRLTHR